MMKIPGTAFWLNGPYSGDGRLPNTSRPTRAGGGSGALEAAVFPFVFNGRRMRREFQPAAYK